MSRTQQLVVGAVIVMGAIAFGLSVFTMRLNERTRKTLAGDFIRVAEMVEERDRDLDRARADLEECRMRLLEVSGNGYSRTGKGPRTREDAK